MATNISQSSGSWGTASELRFVSSLAEGLRGIERLRGYITALALRTEAGGIDLIRVHGHATQLLRQLEAAA